MNDAIRRAILVALNDDHGVNFETYEALLALAEYLPDNGTPIFDAVASEEGRFYLPYDNAEFIAVNSYGMSWG